MNNTLLPFRERFKAVITLVIVLPTPPLKFPNVIVFVKINNSFTQHTRYNLYTLYTNYTLYVFFCQFISYQE